MLSRVVPFVAIVASQNELVVIFEDGFVILAILNVTFEGALVYNPKALVIVTVFAEVDAVHANVV